MNMVDGRNTEDCTSLWRKASEFLKQKSATMFNQWFACVVPLVLEGDSLKLGVPDDFFALMIQQNYQEELDEAVSAAAGRPIQTLLEEGHCAVPEPEVKKTAVPEKAAVSPVPAVPNSIPNVQESRNQNLNTISRRYTFDNFVEGEANRYALYCAQSAAERPGERNPLYIWGGTGLGKTHLLYAVANYVREHHPELHICYIPSENFLNEYVKACMNHTHTEFREYYRNLDMLLLDDVHNLANKTQLQEEFFNTFNAIYSRGGQIIMTSDKQPSEIKGLEARLVSRFQQGSMTEITAPSYETRLAILKKKQVNQAVKIPQNLLVFIAQRVTSQIRALEGALMRLITFCDACRKPPEEITPSMAEGMLSDILDSEADANKVDIDRIMNVVAEYFNIHVHDITGSKRPKNIAEARMLAMYLTRNLTDLSLKEIGQEFGGRNHTTVIHAVKQVESDCLTDPRVQQTVSLLKRKLNIVQE